MTRLLVALSVAAATLVLSPRPAEELSKADAFGLELAACAQAGDKGKPDKCALFGKIKYVEHFPDVKVQVVEHFPDIKVKVVEHFPDDPGEWKMVEHFPDYEVQIVEHFPDYKVKFVEHFPSCD
ncbi:MAG: hypothetical protein GY898_32555 [Proteobacteria bacterium]|nr:hypothetical protein [Pseudomonadota bacterium]